MAEILLRGGSIALVDDVDHGRMLAHSWREIVRRSNTYAICDTHGQRLFMHRLIIQAARGQIVDHVDRNGLNNVRSNLRFVSSVENAANSRPRMTSRFLLERLENMVTKAVSMGQWSPSADEAVFLRVLARHLRNENPELTMVSDARIGLSAYHNPPKK